MTYPPHPLPFIAGNYKAIYALHSQLTLPALQKQGNIIFLTSSHYLLSHIPLDLQTQRHKNYYNKNLKNSTFDQFSRSGFFYLFASTDTPSLAHVIMAPDEDPHLTLDQHLSRIEISYYVNSKHHNVLLLEFISGIIFPDTQTLKQNT